MTSHILVVGATRSLGLELARQYAQRKNTVVFATHRSESIGGPFKELVSQHANIKPVRLDLTDEASIVAAAKEVKKTTNALDVVFVNAGILIDDGQADQLSAKTLNETLQANVIGPHVVALHFHQFLLAAVEPGRKQPQLVFMTSGLGSIADIDEANWILETITSGKAKAGGSPAYSTSKTALNMLSRQWGEVLEPQGVLSIVIHPYVVYTDMNEGKSADFMITAEVSVTGMLEQLETADRTKAKSGMLSNTVRVWSW